MSRPSRARTSPFGPSALLALALVGAGVALASNLAEDALVPGWGNNGVLRFELASGDFDDTFVLAGAGGLDGPHGATLGPDGNLYLPSFFNDKIVRYNAVDGTPLGDFVLPGSGGLDGPVDVRFGADGQLYVASFLNGAVLRYNGATGAFIDAFVAPGTIPNTFTESLLFDGNDDLLVCTGPVRQSVYKFDGDDGAPLVELVAPGAGGLSDPHGMAFGPDGNLYVASFADDNVLRFDGATGDFIDEFVAAGSGGLDAAHGLTFGSDGRLYVTSWNSHEVLRYDGTTGAFVDVWIPAGAGGLLNPQVVILREGDPDSPWADLGFGLAGTSGIPCLTAEATLVAGEPITLTLTNGLPGTTAFLCVGFAALNFSPFYGGTFVPDITPPGFIVPLPVGGDGSLAIADTWPAGVPSGFAIYLQYWLVDGAGPFGKSASNAVVGITP